MFYLRFQDNWPVVVSNLAWAKKVWSRMLHILSREGTTPRMSGFFFKAMLQGVLLFGVNTWVVTPRVGISLGGFKTQVARRLTEQLPRRTTYGTWK